ncbi:unnamed protein product [Sphagnum troendelagicum]
MDLGFQKGSKSPMGSLHAERGGVTSELMNNLPRLQTKARRREDVVISVAGGSCDEDSQAAAAVAAANAEEAEEEQPLTPLGRMFLEPELELFGLCTIGFQNLVDLPQLKQTLRNTLLQNKYFSSIVRKNKRGCPTWVHTEVDMDVIVFEPTGISKADMAAPDFVNNYVAELATAPPIPHTRPLWECHVLNGTTSGNAPAHIVFRIHHCLGDGIAFMSLLFASTRLTANPEKPPPIGCRSRTPPPPPQEQQQLTLRPSVVKSIRKMLIFLWNTVCAIVYLLATLLFLQDSNTVLRGCSRRVEREQKRLVRMTIDMDDMRIVKKAVGGTLNDVLLGMVDASLKRYLQTHSNPAEKLRVRAIAMENVRKSGGLQELPAMMEKGSKVRWGNCIGFWIFPFSLKQFSDPLEHVRAAMKVSDRIKASLGGRFTFWVGTVLSYCGVPTLTKLLTWREITQTTLLVSNLPGPAEQIMLGGNPILHMFPVVAGIPQSFCVYMQSYCGKVTFVVMSAKHIIPNPEIIIQFCFDALHEMKKAAVSLTR